MELFKDALGPPTLSSGEFSMWDDWHGRPRSDEQFFLPHIVTSVVRPAKPTDGTTVLEFRDEVLGRSDQVEFLITDESHHGTVLSGGSPITPTSPVAVQKTAAAATLEERRSPNAVRAPMSPLRAQDDVGTRRLGRHAGGDVRSAA